MKIVPLFKGVGGGIRKGFLIIGLFLYYHNEVRSANKPMVCGIPQGSILDPMLFLLYINDLANISKKLKFILFADDMNFSILIRI